MPNPLARLAEVADDQWGLITLQQAAAQGVGWPTLSRHVAAGHLERVAHGVYRLVGAGAADHLQLRAAWLQLDPATPAWRRLDDPEVALVSHTSAAAVYGLGDFRDDVYEFTLPVRRQTRRKDVRLHRDTVEPEDRLVTAGLPATRAGRMVGDLLADHVEPLIVASIIGQVLRNAYDYPSVVAKHIAPYAERFGLPQGDGVRLLDHMLRLAEVRDRDEFLALAAR